VHSGDKKYGKKIAVTITSDNGNHVEMPLPVKIKATVHGASVAMHPPVENIKTVHAQSGLQMVHPDKMKAEENTEKHTQQNQKEAHSNTGSEVDKNPADPSANGKGENKDKKKDSEQENDKKKDSDKKKDKKKDSEGKNDETKDSEENNEKKDSDGKNDEKKDSEEKDVRQEVNSKKKENEEKDGSKQGEDKKKVHSEGKKREEKNAAVHGASVAIHPDGMKVKATVQAASVAMHRPVDEGVETVHGQSGPQKVHADEMKVKEKMDKHTQQNLEEVNPKAGSEFDKKPADPSADGKKAVITKPVDNANVESLSSNKTEVAATDPKKGSVGATAKIEEKKTVHHPSDLTTPPAVDGAQPVHGKDVVPPADVVADTEPVHQADDKRPSHTVDRNPVPEAGHASGTKSPPLPAEKVGNRESTSHVEGKKAETKRRALIEDESFDDLYSNYEDSSLNMTNMQLLMVTTLVSLIISCQSFY